MGALKLNKREKGCFAFLLSIIALMFLIALLPREGLGTAAQNKALNQSRSIVIALFNYSKDHGGAYPQGKNSTEVFQKLIDEGYITDLSLFYVPMHGKVSSAVDAKKLKPENNCWDMTCCLDSNSPDSTPLVFLTGYKITYQAGASAVPLDSLHDNMTRSWSDWWNGIHYPVGFLEVSYKSNSALSLRANDDGTVPNFIPADFDPKGRTYRQLTPDGELRP